MRARRTHLVDLALRLRQLRAGVLAAGRCRPRAGRRRAWCARSPVPLNQRSKSSGAARARAWLMMKRNQSGFARAEDGRSRTKITYDYYPVVLRAARRARAADLALG